LFSEVSLSTLGHTHKTGKAVVAVVLKSLHRCPFEQVYACAGALLLCSTCCCFSSLMSFFCSLPVFFLGWFLLFFFSTYAPVLTLCLWDAQLSVHVAFHLCTALFLFLVFFICLLPQYGVSFCSICGATQRLCVCVCRFFSFFFRSSYVVFCCASCCVRNVVLM
jgi:hypothetical protein